MTHGAAWLLMGKTGSGGAGAEEMLLMHVRVEAEPGFPFFQNGGGCLNLIV